jgi:hypothetical protein
MKKKEIFRTGFLMGFILVFILTTSVFAQPPGGNTGAQLPGKVVSKIDDLVGIWEATWRGKAGYRQFYADGAHTHAYTIEELKSAPKVTKFWFEGEVFYIEQIKKHTIGKYEVRIQEKSGKAAKLFFTLISEDNSNRGGDITAGMTRVEP